MTADYNARLLERGYESYAGFDVEAINDLTADDVVLHVPGRHPLAGVYRGKSEMWAYFGRITEISGGRGGFEVHSISSDEDHAIGLVVGTAYHGDEIYVRPIVHVWDVVDGRLAEFWEASLDQHAEDAFWSAACA